MDKDIEIIKRYIESKERYKNSVEINELELFAMRSLLKRNEKLSKENEVWKSKIKDKIEELEEEKLYFYSDYAIEERNNKIQVLQELMEDK